MRPFAVLLGIVLGSATALTVSLGMTMVIFLLLGSEFPQRLGVESGHLWIALGWSAGTAALAAVSFVGELQARGWRRWAQGLLLLMLAGVVAYYRK